jgi:hypothetical protein
MARRNIKPIMHVFLDAARKVAARATSISMCYRVGIAPNLLQ